MKYHIRIGSGLMYRHTARKFNTMEEAKIELAKMMKVVNKRGHNRKMIVEEVK